ncbi:Flp pilus assembly protein CpaB [Luteitalea sp.]|uniref:Flp pilus assembly protein CpaB n=1 Tax=Luteitalea sp. TaxID=2004800 RepID=UPI0025C523EA|nr:Flp pilus assembly protein CpaB [Luteitalea sp.]
MKRRGALALLALGILLAGGASVIVLGIARQAGEASRAVIPQVYVVMAAREIPDQAVVTPDALVVRPFPAEFAPPGAISQPEQVVGKFAVGTIYRDQIVMNGHVTTGRKATSLSDRVPPGRVVVWLPMPDLLAGQVGFQPGDRLDILLSLKLVQSEVGDTPSNASNSNGMSTQTTLQNVEIFALGEQQQAGVKAAEGGVSARTSASTQPLALLVDHQDAIIIKYIKDSGGTIDLALRSSDEERIVRTDAVTVDSIAERFRFRVPQEVRTVPAEPRQAMQQEPRP